LSGAAYKGSTDHGAKRALKRNFLSQDVDQAIASAKAAEQVTVQLGKYGTPQIHYNGQNGLTVVIETEGQNAGKLITAGGGRNDSYSYGNRSNSSI